MDKENSRDAAAGARDSSESRDVSRASSVDREADEDGESSSNQDSGAATPTKIKVRVSVVSFLSFGFSHFCFVCLLFVLLF